MFFGPVHLKGNGPFEVIDLEELEAVFQSVLWGGQNNYTLINNVKPSSKLMMNNVHANH